MLKKKIGGGAGDFFRNLFCLGGGGERGGNRQGQVMQRGKRGSRNRGIHPVRLLYLERRGEKGGT